MLRGQENVTLLLGNYGSGKTEVAVNLAMLLARERPFRGITLVDLDLVNPYFRSREPSSVLEGLGIRLVAPDAQHRYADLPILVPEVRSLLMASTAYTIVDVGGDNTGARVIGALHDALSQADFRALMVVNGSRPETRDVTGVIRIRNEIEAAGRLRFSGLVSNTHLMEQTSMEVLVAGWRLAREVEKKTGLALEFLTAPASLAEALQAETGLPVLPLSRYLVPPWLPSPGEKPGDLGKALFRL